MILQNDDVIRRTILYYPTIDLPKGSWIRQVLLFWDEIASIVPFKYDFKQKKDIPVIPFKPDVEYLYKKKVFRPVAPSNFINLEDQFKKIKEFEEEISRIIDSELFNKIIGPKDNWKLKSKVHCNKMSERVFEWFRGRGLAKESEENGEWYLFEFGTALLFMSLLAKYLADIDPSNTMPGTDLKIYESLAFDSPSLNEGFVCLDARYKNTLPIPKENIPLSDILEFKKKNRKALLRFRTQLDKLHKELSEADKPSHIKQILVAFAERIEHGSEELGELLHEFHIETISGSFKTIINIKSPTLWGALGVTLGKTTKIADIPLEWVLPGLAVVGAIEIVHHLIHRNNKKRATLRENDFAYVNHAKEAGII